MQEIEIKKTSIKNTGEDKLERPFIDYDHFIKACVNYSSKNGFSTDEIRKRTRILEALENQKDGKINIEDADIVTLKACIKVMQWGFMHKDIVKFVDDIEKC